MEANQALLENANRMNQVIQSLLALNIPREDIQTASFNVFPRYDYIEGKQVFRGYEVNNELTVKVNTSSQVGIVIDTAIQNGANRISAIQFKLEDADADTAYQHAIHLALQNAQSKANTIAESMRLPMQPLPIEIVEESNEVPIAFKSVNLTEQAISTPIEPGLITISAKVRVKFRY